MCAAAAAAAINRFFRVANMYACMLCWSLFGEIEAALGDDESELELDRHDDDEDDDDEVFIIIIG